MCVCPLFVLQLNSAIRDILKKMSNSTLAKCCEKDGIFTFQVYSHYTRMLLEAFLNFQSQKIITPCGYMKSRPFAASQKYTIFQSRVNKESCKDTSVMVLCYCILLQFPAHFSLNFSLFLIKWCRRTYRVAAAPMGLWGKSTKQISCMFPNGSLVSFSNYFACQSPHD